MSRFLLGLQNGIIYGPVNSRRLGSSLGLNILPIEYKACPFNCIYCQYGFTLHEGYVIDSDGRNMPKVHQVAMALEAGLKANPDVAYVTFSGNGEPTLHPHFTDIVTEVKKIKERLVPNARLAILSNSAFVWKREIRETLSRLDVCFMKLDAGYRELFIKFNRPHRDINFDDIVAGLKQLQGVIIQALFAGGDNGNYNDYAIDRWVETIGQIRPAGCHIYSLDRGTPDDNLTVIDQDGLLRIKQLTEERTGIPVEVF
nr:radical SAM protein [candidate division Zixibacteria bacterium]